MHWNLFSNSVQILFWIRLPLSQTGEGKLQQENSGKPKQMVALKLAAEK
jgi:hypothetical protein